MVNNHGDRVRPLRIGLWDPFQMAIYMIRSPRIQVLGAHPPSKGIPGIQTSPINDPTLPTSVDPKKSPTHSPRWLHLTRSSLKAEFESSIPIGGVASTKAKPYDFFK